MPSGSELHLLERGSAAVANCSTQSVVRIHSDWQAPTRSLWSTARARSGGGSASAHWAHWAREQSTGCLRGALVALVPIDWRGGDRSATAATASRAPHSWSTGALERAHRAHRAHHAGALLLLLREVDANEIGAGAASVVSIEGWGLRLRLVYSVIEHWEEFL